LVGKKDKKMKAVGKNKQLVTKSSAGREFCKEKDDSRYVQGKFHGDASSRAYPWVGQDRLM